MTMQIRMTAIRENEIVTLRGGVCLVGAIAKIAIDCQKIAEIEKQDFEPQRTRRNTEANPTAETRRCGGGRTLGQTRTAKQPQISADERRSENNSAQDGPGSST